MSSLLLTGGSGFLGENILASLKKNYTVKTVGLSEKDDYYINICREKLELGEAFDVVLHAAGKAHSVPKNQEECQAFFDVNFTGTQKLCEALEKAGLPKSFVFISTVAVYGSVEGTNITEEHPLNGDTPYALSKIKAEKFLQEWARKNKVILSILRPALLAGSNAPGNLGAMVKGMKSGRYFRIGKGEARKSILMAKDIANLLPKLENKGGIYNVCDDHHPSFRELEESISKQLRKKNPAVIPYWIAKSMAVVGNCLGESAPINTQKLSKITQSLTFSNEKAKKELQWEPLDVLSHYKI